MDALPVLGQIEIFAFDFAPTGFAACQGQLLPIAQNQALFGLIGPRYGGNGVTDFALPKLPPVTPSRPILLHPHRRRGPAQGLASAV